MRITGGSARGRVIGGPVGFEDQVQLLDLLPQSRDLLGHASVKQIEAHTGNEE